MNLRPQCAAPVMLAITVVTAACGPGAQSPPESTNLVILSIDTLRPDHLGFHGYHRRTSPNLDRLAQRSVVFDQAVTTHVSTAPAHATILSGRYPGSHGLYRNGMRLAAIVPTMAEWLTAEGFATGAFVSGWTLQRHTGLDRGFTRYDDDLGPPRAGARREGRATTDAALKWLEERVSNQESFFLFLHLFEPHWPYDPPPEEALKFLSDRDVLMTMRRPVHLDRLLSVNRLTPAEKDEYVARYDGEIVVADRLAARVFDALENLGVAHNTVLIFLSDHGETLFEREWSMDHGTRPYDEQALVPLVLHIPGNGSAGRRVPDQVSLLDVFPTIAEVFAIEPPSGLQGRSLVPLTNAADNEGPPRAAFVTARPEPERLPHIQAPLGTRGLVCAIRLPGVKLVEYPMSGGHWFHELFNLSEDPGERTDRAPENAASVAALHAELERWRRSTSTDGAMPPPELSPEVEEALRELGYISD